MALTHSTGFKLGEPAPHFTLPATDGKEYSLESFSSASLLVVVFTCNHCPYAKASEDRLIQLQKEFADRNVKLVLINSNDAVEYPEDSFAAMKVRATEKKFPFPYLYDESQAVAKAYNAKCTPDIFVFDSSRALRYNGRIDDNWQDASKVTRRDLHQALTDLLSRKPISFQPVPSMGCNIKWRSS